MSENTLLILETSRDRESVFSRIENRDRLLNIVFQIQERIEAMLNIIDPSFVNEELTSKTRNWVNNLTLAITQIEELDQRIMVKLSDEKSELAKEISFLFKNKEKFKGYNLSNVKK